MPAHTPGANRSLERQLLALDTKSVNTTGQVWTVLLCQQIDVRQPGECN